MFIQIILDKRKVKGVSNKETITIVIKLCKIVKPNAINIDYSVNPISIAREINIPIQGGLDPKILLTDKDNLKKQTLKYLNIFKDHPYIFNLGHGVLPQTEPNMVDYLVKTVKDY